jgi:F-type H+-transporting ATPase subunit b
MRASRQLAMWVTCLLALAAPAAAQADNGPSAEAERATKAAAGDPATGHGDHGGGHGAAHDPTQHFNFIGQTPGDLFDYIGKDEYGGKMGDGKMEDHKTGQVTREEQPASPPFIFMVLNFALLLLLLAWKGRPAVRKVAAERHDMIKTALDEAAALRKQAAAKLAEYEARLKEADAQIKELVEGMRADAKSEEQRILAAAEAQAAMMKRDAELRIAAEIELARAQLTREVTAAAVAATEDLLRARMTPADQQQLVTGFIAGIPQPGQPGQPGNAPGPGGRTGKAVR